MKLAICYFSATGRTETMAKAIAAGILEQSPDCDVRCLHIDQVNKEYPENIDFVNGADGILIGTPDYYAAESWQIKKWLDNCPCKLAGAFATANVTVGGPGVAIEHILTHLLVRGCMVYSGGSSCGQPFIHLGPVCFRDQEPDGAALMQIFGRRFAAQAAKLAH